MLLPEASRQNKEDMDNFILKCEADYFVMDVIYFFSTFQIRNYNFHGLDQNSYSELNFSLFDFRVCIKACPLTPKITSQHSGEKNTYSVRGAIKGDINHRNDPLKGFEYSAKSFPPIYYKGKNIINVRETLNLIYNIKFLFYRKIIRVRGAANGNLLDG